MDGDRGPGRRPAPGPRRAAHRLGQVGGLLRRHRAAAQPGRRADRHRLAAAGPDAQPDRGRRPRRHPRGHDQLDQQRRLGRDLRRDQPRRGRRAAGEPGAAQQPGVPRRGAAPAGRGRRAAGRRRGALHLRLGPRLPAGLPPDPDHAGRPARGDPGAGDHGHGQRPGHRRRRRAALGDRHGRPRRRARPARRPRPRVAAPRRRPAAQPGGPAGLAGRAPRELPGPGIVYCLTVAATQEVAEHLRAAGYDAQAYSGQTEQAERLAAEDDLLSGRLKALVATSALGMGFDMPDLGWVVNLGAPASPIAYYQQVGRAGRAIDRAVAVLLPGREDRDIWDYFGSLAFPAEPEVRQALADPGRRGQAAVDGRARAARHPAPHPAGDDAQGARRRRRRTPGARRLDRHRRAVGLRRRALRAGARDAAGRAGRDAGLRCGAGLSDAVPARGAGRPGRRAVRSLRQLRRAGARRRRPRPTWSSRPSSGWSGPASPSSRARCGRPA